MKGDREFVNLSFGTNAPGGIRSVLQLYDTCGLSEEFNITRISTHEEGSVIKRVFIFLNSLYLLFKNCITQRVRIIHLHVAAKGSFWRKAILILLSKALGKKVIFHLHGSEFKDFFNTGLSPGLRKLATRIIKQTDVAIVLSSQWADWLKETVGHSNIVVLQNFVIPAEVKESARKKKPVFIFLGRVGDRKGTFDLIKAFAIVRKSIDCELWIAGDGEIDTAKSLASQSGISDSVTFFGWIDSAKRNELLSESNIYVLPSYNEGQPMSIAEAMSAGLPIISTLIGGIPDQVSEGVEGYLIKPGDIDSLAERMVRLASDNSLREQMGQRATTKFNEAFSPTIAIPKLRKIYRDLSR